MQCPKCEFPGVIKKGSYSTSSGVSQRYKCKNCNHNFYLSSEFTKTPDDLGQFVFPATNIKKYVITSAQTNTPIVDDFLSSLLTFCETNSAKLLVIPLKSLLTENVFPHEIEEYLMEHNFIPHPKLQVLGALGINQHIEDPLSGLSPLSKGNSLIVGHNQLQMMTIPVQKDDHPVLMTTTGTLSEKNYIPSKQGFKAEFNHSNSAVLVELDEDIFHIRHLNFDGYGFFDLHHYYSPNGTEHVNDSVEAIVTGDEHAIFIDEKVKNATYGPLGIVESLRPKYIVRHDILDCYSISHHHRKNFLTQYKKFVSGKNDIGKELNDTINFVVETTPKSSTNILVASNHTNHLSRWLNECEVKNEPWNALTYHWLMYMMLDCIHEDSSYVPDPFELYSKYIFEEMGCNVKFLSRENTHKILDVEVAIHGDMGSNGSRGSRKQFSRLPSKTIIGHSHMPGIEKGCYQVGTSTMLKLEYNEGPSSWMNTHCLIYKNGKRQLISIIHGRWKA